MKLLLFLTICKLVQIVGSGVSWSEGSPVVGERVRTLEGEHSSNELAKARTERNENIESMRRAMDAQKIAMEAQIAQLGAMVSTEADKVQAISAPAPPSPPAVTVFESQDTPKVTDVEIPDAAAKQADPTLPSAEDSRTPWTPIGSLVEAAEQSKADALLEDMPQWNIWAILVTCVVTGAYLALPLICCSMCFWDQRFRRPRFVMIPHSLDYGTLSEGDSLWEKLYPQLLGEAIATLTLPIWAIVIALAASATTGWTSVPLWAQILAVLPPMMRLCYVDSYFVGLKEKQPRTSCGVLVEELKKRNCLPPHAVSKMEAVDSSLDGVAAVAVSLLWLRPTFRARLLLGWRHLPLIAPALFSLTLPGTMLIVLIVATLMQFSSMLIGNLRWKHRAYLIAETAGLGSTARSIFDSDEADELVDDLISEVGHVGRLVYEAALQSALQSTAAMCSGQKLIEQPALALSMTSSICFGLKKSLKLTWTGIQFIRDKYLEKVCFGVIFTGGGFFATGLLLWSAGRVINAQHCPSLIYGFSSGCVEVAQALMPNA